MLKGQATDLWAPLDLGKAAQHEQSGGALHQQISGRARGRRRRGLLVHHAGHQHRESIRKRPTSWAALWDPANKDKLGLLALVSNSFLLEVTAKTFFGGTKALDTEEGILKALEKLAEVKPNVRLWYRDEAQFEQALKSGEIPMGQYYHDVTGLAGRGRAPGALDLPQGGRHSRLRLLGGVQGLEEGRGGAGLHRLYVPAGDPGDAVAQGRHLADGEARAARPDRRGVRARSPTTIDPIIPRYDLYQTKSDWLNQRWTEMIVG